MDEQAIARWRMHTLALAGARYPSPVAVVDGLLAVQAENYRHAAWAVACRADGELTEGDFDRVFDHGAILRTHVLRPTWHFVSPADIAWLVEVTAPRVRRTLVQVQRGLGLDDRTLERAVEVIVGSLASGRHLTRNELRERLDDEGIASSGQLLGVMLMQAELLGLVCSGRVRSTEQTYALLAERAPGGRRLDRSEALAELVLRYFTGHGPATERDLSYWASLTLTDVRRGLSEVAGELESFSVDGRTYWHASPPPQRDTISPRAHLLLMLDEYHNGYQDSRYSLDGAGIVPRGRAANYGMTLLDGQMVGNMRRTVGSDSVRFEIGLFRTLDASEKAAVQEAAERQAQFLGLARAEVSTHGP